jgi:hypothetical protein
MGAMTPLTADDILALTKDNEGQTTEFKTSFSEEDDILRTLSAFAHGSGGVVLVGVKPDGTINGTSIGGNTLERFASTLRRCTLPPLKPDVYEVNVAGANVVAISVAAAPKSRVVYAFGIPYVRVGRSTMVMSPDEQRERYFAGFRADMISGFEPHPVASSSWGEREKGRVAEYERNSGLFLVHTWRPSRLKGQVADIVLYLHQHGEGPLTAGTVKSVEYHLGPMFSDKTMVAADAASDFRLEVSAYGPMLCVAFVNFDDGTSPLRLSRYVDF